MSHAGFAALAALGLTPRHDRLDVEQRFTCWHCGRGPGDKTLAAKLRADGGWVAHCHRCQWAAGGKGESQPKARVAAPSPQPLGTLAPSWGRFYRESAPVRGTLGEVYLKHRACPIPPAEGALRFHARAFHWLSGRRGPALVALATDAIDRTPRTLHLTFLAADGRGKANLKPPRLLLPKHNKAGAVVRLWPDEAVTHGLGIAEGIESALSLALAGLPVWAAIDAGNLAAFPVLGGIEELSVAVDRDPAGERAADELAHRWITAGRRVRLVKPKAGDLNDVATGTYE